ncbi:lipopolysaccharide biosynthesis protein [Micromonospora carbonacea]|uniref:Polysaccharide biosynthesis C-terminal domain-containing protein n=1 Tax=Micromonospora carbonacea TaxID=47853 RepID=A0A7H8XGE9_9ACTN|nr:polysaccharide biosynthesis C-terminal domain-containing protein [Micromonospora carbonacea]MBB5828356.1 O-antigen/teichoic acid export membrane protein [Micromonospora carbonacea]QLD24027.1 polysaccharide biosynthesis C-terminal domain-containing protein [Micromonospora carbonacea]
MLAQVGLLGLSQAGVTVAAFGSQVLLARTLTREDFGSFTAVLAVVSLTAPLAVFGVSELWLQVFGQEGARAYRWVGPSLRLAGAACAALLLGVLAWSAAELPDATAAVRALLATVVAAQAALALAGSVRQLRGDYRGLSALQLAPHLGRVLVTVAVWAAGLSVVAAAAGYAVVAVATVAACLLATREFRRGAMPLEGHPAPAAVPAPAVVPAGPAVPVGGLDAGPRLGELLGAATPYVLGNVCYLLGIHFGTVLAAELLGGAEAALLAVPMAVLTAVYLVPRVVYQQYLLGKLHRWAGSDAEAVLLAYRWGSAGMVALGVVVAAAVAVGGLVALPVVFGPEYRDAAPVLAVLALAVPFRFGGAAVAALLTSGGLLRRKVVYQAVGAVVLLAALAVAVPAWGVRGAAGATVLAEAVLCCLLWVAARRGVVGDAPLPTWRDLRRRLSREAPRAS